MIIQDAPHPLTGADGSIVITANQSTHVKAVVAQVLSELAPEELLLLDEFDPCASRNGKAGAGPLGIGLEATAALILPIVWKITESLLHDLWAEARKEGAKAVVQAAMARLKGSGQGSKEPSEELVKEVAKRLEGEGVDSAKVQSLARSIAAAVLKHHAGS